DGPVDQDGMRHHSIEQLLVAQRRVAKAKLRIGRAFLAQQLSHRYAHARDKLSQHVPRWRCLQIFDDMRFNARITDHRQRVARGTAIRVMIDDDVHDLPHAALLRGDDAPSAWPISVSLVRSDALSRLATGRDVKAEM